MKIEKITMESLAEKAKPQIEHLIDENRLKEAITLAEATEFFPPLYRGAIPPSLKLFWFKMVGIWSPTINEAIERRDGKDDLRRDCDRTSWHFDDFIRPRGGIFGIFQTVKRKIKFDRDQTAVPDGKRVYFLDPEEMRELKNGEFAPHRSGRLLAEFETESKAKHVSELVNRIFTKVKKAQTILNLFTNERA